MTENLFDAVKRSLTMRQVAESLGYEPNRSGFIHSPFSAHKDKTASCKLYKDSFYDYSTNTGGDLIKFTAIVKGFNNWQACQYLIETFSLPLSLSDHKSNREEIERQKSERQRQKDRNKKFRKAYLEEIEELEQWETVCKKAIEEKIYDPLSEEQNYIILELQKVSRKLDILCTTDCETYRRLKVKNNLPSERPQWLLDVLEILKDDGKFQATEAEIKQITAKRNHELSKRPPFIVPLKPKRKDGEKKRVQE